MSRLCCDISTGSIIVEKVCKKNTTLTIRRGTPNPRKKKKKKDTQVLGVFSLEYIIRYDPVFSVKSRKDCLVDVVGENTLWDPSVYPSDVHI